MIRIREAEESDAEGIREVFLAIYENDYSHPQFYDIQSIKKMVYSDDTVILVAEDTETKRVVGTASVLLKMGANSDLLGEFGRLAVHPDARQRGIGRLLMEERLDRIKNRLHLALVEARAIHPYAQKISLSHDFAPVGFQPLKLLLAQRESLVVLVRYFGDCLKLRKNNPRLIAEIYPLAEIALKNCGLDCDVVVEDTWDVYPHDERFELEELTAEGYSTLLHFQRGRIRDREIFGPIRLHHGLFKIRALKSNYLLALEEGRIVGAVGFNIDKVERTLRIFELISLSERPVRFLLSEVIRNSRDHWDIDYLEVDVSSYAPRMQSTLMELGFMPAAYIPAMVFHEVERLDGIRMVLLLVRPETGPIEVIPETRPLVDLVMRNFTAHQVIPKVAQAVPKIALFCGLNQEQVTQLAGRCSVKQFQPGEEIFAEHTEGEEGFLILDGTVEITAGQPSRTVGTVGPGECLGEMSLLTQSPHSATARAQNTVEVAVFHHQDMTELVRLRPDIGVVIYRNLATGLGNKLIRSDLR